MKLLTAIVCLVIILVSVADCFAGTKTPTLKDAFAKDFLIGGALSDDVVSGRDPKAAVIAKKHFNTITAENTMKWMHIHPQPDKYNFTMSDRFVNFGVKNKMFVVGHTLVWHWQTPRWVFEDENGNDVDRETLLARMKEHIFTVMGHYKGKVKGWDVVNEAIDDDGSLRKTKWLEIIGEDFIAKAFEYAHEADPNAELYYNDFTLDEPAKRKACVKLVQELKAKGLRIDGVGLQGHWALDYPKLEEVEAFIDEMKKLGVKVMITEMDVDVLPKAMEHRGADLGINTKMRKELDPYTNGLPNAMQKKLADRYAEFFDIFLKHSDEISRVTLWGVYDKTSWLNKFPVRGRTNYPLLFDRNYQPKPAFSAVIKTKTQVSPNEQQVSGPHSLFSSILGTANSIVHTLFSVFVPGRQVKTFQNPIITGFFPDPSICRVGDDYYSVHSTFEYFPGVPVMHSKDLVHWQMIGYCLTRKSQLPLNKTRASGGIYAPTIRYHNGTFYMVTTNVDEGGNFYVTAKNPAGPWSEPIWLKDGGGMDPSLFFDDDGKVYYTRHEGQADGYVAQAEIDIKTGKLKEPVKKIWGGAGGVWVEGPHLYKINGKYYLMASEGGTSYDHRVTVARSDSPWGPFESDPNNPILTHRNQPQLPIQVIGHADIVDTPDGWWLICLGVRPQGGRYHHIGRETFLAPVAFNKEGWPVVNDNKPIEFTMPAPKLPQHTWPNLPAKDDFKNKTLALEWNYLRDPVQSNYSLTERPGFLRLAGSDVNMSNQDTPTFVGRRQTDFNCVASTLVEFDPNSENEEAGLVVRGNDRHHYEIAVTTKDGKRQVLFRKIFKGNLVEPVKYIEIPNGPIILSVKAAPLTYEFFCQPKGGKVISLGTAATKGLSVEEIGFDYGMCFTGAYFGMYATGNGKKCTQPADFDWFEYVSTE